MNSEAASNTAQLEHRITVRIDETTYEALMQLLKDAEVSEKQRCGFIRDLLSLALGIQSQILVCRLGILSEKELRDFERQVTSISKLCNVIANRLRSLPPLHGEQDQLITLWFAAINSCTQTIQEADQLVGRIKSIVSNRSDPPLVAIAAIRQIRDQFASSIHAELDPKKKARRVDNLRRLNEFLGPIRTLPDV